MEEMHKTQKERRARHHQP
jgi:hypothetical protein